MPRFLPLAFLLFAWLAQPTPVVAQDEPAPADAPPAEAAEPELEPAADPPAASPTVPPVVTALEGAKAEQLATGLTRPMGLAVRPGLGRARTEVWIADSGAHRIVRFDSAKPAELGEVVTGFTADQSAGEALQGPLALHFQSRTRLVVATSGATPLRVYDVEDSKLPLEADKAILSAELLDTQPGGGLVAVSRNAEGIYAVGAGEGLDGWILRAATKGGQLEKLELFNPASKGTEVEAPRAIAFSAKGYQVVSLAGSDDTPGDSVLAFFDPYRKESPPVLVLSLELDDVVAIAYSPTTGSLYAADFAPGDPERGGIYRIDARQNPEPGQTECEVVLVHRIPHPAAIDFDSEGNLYVATWGADQGDQANKGVLLKITGEF